METQLETRSIEAGTKADLAGVAAMGPDFWREGSLHGSFIPDVFVRTWSALMDARVGHVLVMKRGSSIIGTLGFFAVQDPNDGALVAQEAFWFVRQDERGAGLRLLAKYEEVAKALGATRMSMAHINGLMDEKLEHLFTRRGYKATETHYWRNL